MKWATRLRPKIDRITCPWRLAHFFRSAAGADVVQSDAVLAARLFTWYCLALGETHSRNYGAATPMLFFSHSAKAAHSQRSITPVRQHR